MKVYTIKQRIIIEEGVKMANVNAKHKDNIAGAWYCTDPDDDEGEGCIACNVCYTGAPDFFAEDEDGNAFIKIWNLAQEAFVAF